MIDNPLREAAVDYAQRGWRVLPVKPGAKVPLTRNGVKDATCDERTILQWWDRWPDASIGIATGAPGPSVLDIDDLEKGKAALRAAEATGAPQVATGRGRHFFYEGLDLGTITLGYGELRGTGSYVIAPPSVHASGTQYVWLDSPNGHLPKVPARLADRAKQGTAGKGQMEVKASTELVPAGARHAHLSDFTVRLVRSGITDRVRLRTLLQNEYETACVTSPGMPAAEIDGLVSWATQTNIAQRERLVSQVKGSTTAASDAAPEPPLDSAPYLATIDMAGGWAPARCKAVRRYGLGGEDPLTVHLTNGIVVRVEKQGAILGTATAWSQAVLLATRGGATPPTMKTQERSDLLRSLCFIAEEPGVYRDVDNLLDAVVAMLEIAEPVKAYTLTTAVNRYALIRYLNQRPDWPSRPGALVTTQPVVIVDAANDTRYLRAAEVRAHIATRELKIPSPQMAARMAEIGITHRAIHGREARIAGHGTRVTAHAVLYELPEVLGGPVD